jgi:hypothetical protein
LKEYQNYLPTQKVDYVGSIAAIHRLQDTYLIDAKELSLGNMSHNYPSRPLTGKQQKQQKSPFK